MARKPANLVYGVDENPPGACSASWPSFPCWRRSLSNMPRPVIGAILKNSVGRIQTEEKNGQCHVVFYFDH